MADDGSAEEGGVGKEIEGQQKSLLYLSSKVSMSRGSRMFSSGSHVLYLSERKQNVYAEE